MSRANVGAEREKQATKVQAAYDYLKQRYGCWVPAPDIARAIRSMAVSTKLSQARVFAEHEGNEIVWNEQPQSSCYMLRPVRIGRDAGEQVPSPWNQDRPFGEPFALKP